MALTHTNIWDVAYLWPFCALAARYKEDSGDGDNNFYDFIDDTISKWLPNATITKMPITKKLDFTYSVEYKSNLLIVCLGTEGSVLEQGWISNFSPQIETKNFNRLGGHVDFIEAGEDIAVYYQHLVRDYKHNFWIVGHSRGGARCITAAWYWARTFDIFPQKVISFCAPPVFTHKKADEYNKIGLGNVTIRPVMYNDVVDILGLPILKHVGVALKLPRVKSDIIERKKLLGKLFYGHAYSSVFDSLIKFCRERSLMAEAKWLVDTKWVSII